LIKKSESIQPNLEYSIKLVHLGLAGEEGLHEQQLSEDAAQGPDVDVGGVLLDAQQEFGGAVPQRHYNGGVRLQRRPVLTSQAKVSHLKKIAQSCNSSAHDLSEKRHGSGIKQYWRIHLIRFFWRDPDPTIDDRPDRDQT
jgi:hypothetical protein